MKRMLSILVILSLLSTACLGFSEEGKESWKERLANAAEDLSKDIQEASQKAADIVIEKADQVSETISTALSTVGEKLDTLPEQASDNLKNVKETLSENAEQLRDSAAEKLEKLSEQAEDVLANAKDSLPDYAEQAKDTIAERLKKLSVQVSGILESAKKDAPVYAEQAKGTVAQKVDKLSENISEAAQTAKKLLMNALNAIQKSAVKKLQELVNWLKGGTKPVPFPTLPNAAISATGGLSATKTPTQSAFFPVPGYSFYFGMTWAEARALGVNYLNDSRANAYHRARALVMLNKQNTSLYFLWFAGETDGAYLFEVDEFAFSSQDTLIPPQDAYGQYRINTTEATVHQVYTEKASYCGQHFGSASNLESGLLVPSLMFGENDAGISQTQVYLNEDYDGVNVITHFVYTTDCGVNVIIYQHMGNSVE